MEKKLLFIGDSITDMGRDRNSDYGLLSYGNSYVFCITGELGIKYPNKYKIINKGIGGNRVTDLYAREKIDCINYEPDVVTIYIGVNDVWHEVVTKNGVPLDRFVQVYEMMIDDIRKALPNVKLFMIAPVVEHGSAVNEKFDEFKAVYDYAKAVEKLAKKKDVPCLSLQKEITEFSEKNGEGTLLLDGVHPSPSGARFIADKWLEMFLKTE